MRKHRFFQDTDWDQVLSKETTPVYIPAVRPHPPHPVGHTLWPHPVPHSVFLYCCSIKEFLVENWHLQGSHSIILHNVVHFHWVEPLYTGGNLASVWSPATFLMGLAWSEHGWIVVKFLWDPAISLITRPHNRIPSVPGILRLHSPVYNVCMSTWLKLFNRPYSSVYSVAPVLLIH